MEPKSQSQRSRSRIRRSAPNGLSRLDKRPPQSRIIRALTVKAHLPYFKFTTQPSAERVRPTTLAGANWAAP
jgi:hypothetical protein